MTAATVAASRTDLVSAEEVSSAIAEATDRRSRRTADLAERRREAESLRERIGEVVAADGDVSTLRQQLRDADDDCDSLERAIARIGQDLTRLEEQLARARAQDAKEAAERARATFAAVLDELDTAIVSFLSDTFLPLDRRHAAAARIANRTQLTADGARGARTIGTAAERVLVQHRNANPGSEGLQRLVIELRQYANARGLASPTEGG